MKIEITNTRGKIPVEIKRTSMWFFTLGTNAGGLSGERGVIENEAQWIELQRKHPNVMENYRGCYISNFPGNGFPLGCGAGISQLLIKLSWRQISRLYETESWKAAFIEDYTTERKKISPWRGDNREATSRAFELLVERMETQIMI